VSQQELLKRVVEALEGSGCPSMLTGSYASSYYGEPRLSHDIDLLVDLPAGSIDALVRHFPPPDYLLQREQVEAAVRDRTMFNLLHIPEGDKVDFWLLTDDPFDASRFSRRKKEILFGIPVEVSSAEDTILMKLKWSNLAGGSEIQFRDALRVYEVQREALDAAYIHRWIKEMNLQVEWQRLVEEADSTV
jgi:hypothetical protein